MNIRVYTYSTRLHVRSISHSHQARVSCDSKDERYTGSEGVEEPPNSIVAHTKERCLPFTSLVEHRSNIDCRNDVSLPADRSVSLIPVHARKILRISARTRSIDRSIVGFNSKKSTRVPIDRFASMTFGFSRLKSTESNYYNGFLIDRAIVEMFNKVKLEGCNRFRH